MIPSLLVAPAAAVRAVTAHRIEVQAIKTAIVMALLVVGFRVLGKREAAQLNLYDLAMLMALANAVQNAMTGGLGNLPLGLATSSTLLVTAWAVTRFVIRRPGVEARVIGAPTLLVRNGHVLERRARRSLVTDNDLAEACRQRGLDGIHDCAMAVLEVDGSISVIPEAEAAPAGRADPEGAAPGSASAPGAASAGAAAHPADHGATAAPRRGPRRGPRWPPRPRRRR